MAEPLRATCSRGLLGLLYETFGAPCPCPYIHIHVGRHGCFECFCSFLSLSLSTMLLMWRLLCLCGRSLALSIKQHLSGFIYPTASCRRRNDLRSVYVYLWAKEFFDRPFYSGEEIIRDMGSTPVSRNCTMLLRYELILIIALGQIHISIKSS